MNRTVKGGDRIRLKGGGNLEPIDAPGHSPCGLAAWLEKDRVLFVSDAPVFKFSKKSFSPFFSQLPEIARPAYLTAVALQQPDQSLQIA